MVQDPSRAVTSSNEEAAPTILVLDDDPTLQLLLDRLLRLHGFHPLQASTISEAIAIAEHSRVNAFILDITLGGNESGLDMLAWARRQRRYAMTPIFILTGKFDVPDDERTLIRRHRAYVFYKGQSLQLLMDYLTRLVVDPNSG